MKKLLLATAVSICSINAYELNFTKNFSIDVSPDILSSHITIKYENKDESRINEKLEEFNSFFKDQDEVTKKNGRFNLNPRYRYQNNKQKFLGYVGNLSYTVQSKDATKLNNFLSELIILKKEQSTPALKLSIGSVSWIISREQRELNINSLRQNAIQWIKDYKQTISSSCTINQINIGNNRSYNNQPVYAMRSNSLGSAKDISPINSSKKINLSVNYKLDCR